MGEGGKPSRLQEAFSLHSAALRAASTLPQRLMAQHSSSTRARRKWADPQLPTMAKCDSLSGSRTTLGIFLQPGIWLCSYRGKYVCLTDFVQTPKAGTLGWFNIGVHSFAIIQWGSREALVRIDQQYHFISIYILSSTSKRRLSRWRQHRHWDSHLSRHRQMELDRSASLPATTTTNTTLKAKLWQPLQDFKSLWYAL